MISNFPTPLPDELLYSICARYAFRVQYPRVEAVNLELFGSRSLAAVIDLPCHLSYLDKNLPSGHSLSPKTLIYKHTLLSFYSPFLPRERVRRILTEMEGCDASAIHKLTGVTASTIRRPDWLRFCTSCVEEDRRLYGECYWHRVHQVPGVLICPTHDVFLENSIVRARNRVDGATYVPAEQALISLISKSLYRSASYRLILSNLARDVSWLLDQGELMLGFEALRQGYLNLLTERRLASVGGRIRTNALIQVIRSTYPTNLLEILQCDFNEQKAHNWPARIVKHLNQNKVSHPLRHLLLIQALGHTAKSFIKLCIHASHSVASPVVPFGSGPWPCLNPTCTHFGELIITTHTLSNKRPISKSIIGTFQCNCGFTYTKYSTDSSPDNTYRFDKIKHYGQVWETSLRKLWKDSSISVQTAAKRLGVAHNTVKYQAIRLGLNFPRRGPSPKIMYMNIKLKRQIRRQVLKSSPAEKSKQLDSYRRKWLEARKKYPRASRSKLQSEIAPKAYYWLKKHDRNWLYSNMPLPYRRVGSARQVNWHKRDVEFAEGVRKTALRLKNIQGIPIRVTKSSIGRDLDRQDWLSNKQIRKLPITTNILEEVLESRADYAIRRVRWASTHFREEGLSPAWSTLATRARIGWDMWYVPQVKAVINAEWSSLQDLRCAISIAVA